MDSNTSLWSATGTSPTFPQLMADEVVDVVIVGGGITGLTAAMLLAATGKRVTLVEARRIGAGVSHRSTVHLTEAVDSRYQNIESDFGKEGAKLVAQSSRAAIEKIAALVKAFSTPCELVRREPRDTSTRSSRGRSSASPCRPHRTSGRRRSRSPSTDCPTSGGAR
jgi:glycine/D-amino acid oxidase-like deaminating enzyme